MTGSAYSSSGCAGKSVQDSINHLYRMSYAAAGLEFYLENTPFSPINGLKLLINRAKFANNEAMLAINGAILGRNEAMLGRNGAMLGRNGLMLGRKAAKMANIGVNWVVFAMLDNVAAFHWLRVLFDSSFLTAKLYLTYPLLMTEYKSPNDSAKAIAVHNRTPARTVRDLEP